MHETHTNRLVHEKSPYLLQHAHNPVDWFPWGEEAFAKARAEQKPIFLSIGYSTCHWCHVMERESFEKQEVADVLNAHFVAIKVDREERPDVDNIYMAATQAMSGNGGWPMSVFLTPDLKPFYAGTYFPPQPAYGRPSFLQLLARIEELWQTQRDALIESSNLLTKAIQGEESTQNQTEISLDLLKAAYLYFDRTYDKVYGGFGGAPKFPRPVQSNFLFRYFAVAGESRAKEMALYTLRKMAAGGMHDQLGGGFHRYSVDTQWRVSHFEKMLYDQALLVESYLDAYQLTHERIFADVARDIIEYVLRDMTHPDGGFYSAEDADSEGIEGKFYAWTIEEVRRVLGKEADPFIEYYGFTPEGNFEHGTNVLHITRTLEEVAVEHHITTEALETKLSQARQKLFALREHRVRPHLDDKILTSWNGLMIGAIARAGGLLQEARYVAAAIRAASFIWFEVRTETGLLHRWRDGEARFNAYLDSYAFLIKGYLELYEATFDAEWLHRAIALQAEQDQHLYDRDKGGYFLNRESSDILVRSKSEYDGAEPSGNSVAVQNLVRLALYTEDGSYQKRAEESIKYFATRISEFPHAMPELISAIPWITQSPSQMVLSGQNVENLHAEASLHYIPYGVTLYAQSAIGNYARSLEPKDGLPTAYFCRNFTCELPVTTVKALRELLLRNQQ